MLYTFIGDIEKQSMETLLKELFAQGVGDNEIRQVPERGPMHEKDRAIRLERGGDCACQVKQEILRRFAELEERAKKAEENFAAASAATIGVAKALSRAVNIS